MPHLPLLLWLPLAAALAVSTAGLRTDVSRSASLATARISVHAGQQSSPSAIVGLGREATNANASGPVASSTAAGADCTYFGGQHGHRAAPFQMHRKNADGENQNVLPVRDPGGSGLCIFPEATCAGPLPCCKPASWVLHGSKASGQLMTWIGLGLTLLVVVALTRPPSPPGGGAANPGAVKVGGEVERLKSMSQLAEQSNSGLVLGLIFSNVVSVIMSISTQGRLDLMEGNAMLAADAFLTPVKDVFQFLEDAVSVKIAHAIGAGDVAAVDAILALGVKGGLGLEVVAACVTTAIAFWPSAIHILLTPDAGFHAIAECSLLPSASAVVEASRGFWLLRSWTWPLSFATMALSGLLLSLRWNRCLGLAMVASGVVMLVIWLGLTHNFQNQLDLLGWANLASSAAFAIVCAVAMVCHKPSSDVARLSDSLLEEPAAEFPVTDGERRGPGTPSAQAACNAGSGLSRIGLEACWQGLQAMALEVCVQFCLSCGVYMAGSLGIGPMYQVGAMQAAMPLYGLAFSGGLSIAVKIVGSILLGRGCFLMFSGFIGFVTFWSIVFAILPLCVVLPFREQLSFALGGHGCAYASSSACIQIYAGIFGEGVSSQGSLQDSFGAFAFGAMAMNLFLCFKCALYSCCDFRFMAWAGMAVVLLVYVPSICVARLALRSAKAVYIAMYLPMLVLAVVFRLRLRVNISRMLSGADGPWSKARAASTLAA